MARLLRAILVMALSTLPVAAAGADPASPWSTDERAKPIPNFGIAPQSGAARLQRDDGSRIIAGTEIMRNGTLGFGFFGQKSESPALSPVTARDLTVSKRRKAAVGFSLKF